MGVRLLITGPPQFPFPPCLKQGDTCEGFCCLLLILIVAYWVETGSSKSLPYRSSHVQH